LNRRPASQAKEPLELQIAPAVPSPPSPFDLRPVGIGPSFEHSERLAEGPAKFGELAKGGRLDPTGVEMTHNQAVTFSPLERVGQHLVGNAVQRVVEVLVAATAVL
jgi:hypothetical protein